METKSKIKLFKNLTILFCAIYMVLNYLIDNLILSWAAAGTALIMLIITLLLMKKAKHDKYMDETYRKPKIRRR